MAETPKEELARRLATYPKEALPYLRHGFSATSQLNDDTRAKVLASVVENFKRGTRRLDSSSLTDITNLPERETDAIASVYSLLIGVLSETQATPDELIEVAAGQIFLPQHEEVVRSIATSICNARDEITLAVAQTQLAGEVLPSLYTFDVAVDLRIRVVDGKVVTTAPVAIAHIETDSGDAGTWVQLSRGDLETVIRSLQKALGDMTVAETLAPKMG